MAEISDYVPADGVRFDKAFERLFEMDPRAAELRAKLDGAPHMTTMWTGGKLFERTWILFFERT
jgi:hypothetical protein